MCVGACVGERAVRACVYLYLQAQFLKRSSQHFWQLVVIKRLGTRLGEQMKAVPRLHSVEII